MCREAMASSWFLIRCAIRWASLPTDVRESRMSATLDGVSQKKKKKEMYYLHCSTISGGYCGRERIVEVDWMNWATCMGSDGGPNWFSM